MDKLPWLFVIGFGFLSVFNFLQYQEIKSQFEQIQKSPQGAKNRYRRDISNKDDDENWYSFNQKKFNKFIEEQTNQTIYSQISRILKQFKSKNICEDLAKCQREICDEVEKTMDTTEEKLDGRKTKCLRGPPGPPGPRGPPGPGLEKPKLVSSTLNNGEVNITKSKIFECKFYGNPVPVVNWKVSAKDFDVDSTINKQNFEITSRLTVYNATWNDQGLVECHAKSLLGEAQDSGNLSVLTKPKILSKDALVFAPEGITFDFPECKVRANPVAKVTWKRIFWPLPIGRFSVEGNGLRISNVQFKDEGFYVCEAENFLGRSKANIQLKVKPLGIHQSSKPFVAMGKGETASIYCSAYGNAREMTGSVTTQNNKVDYKIERSSSNNTITVKAQVTKEDTYICKIRNTKNGKTIEIISRIDIVCKRGWTLYLSHCYAFVNQQKTWDEAEAYCQRNGAHLASIMNDKENMFVYRLTPGGHNNYWLGLTDKKIEGSFTLWSDGSRATYKNFDTNQPNNAGTGNQDCVSFYKNANHKRKWNDWECNKRFAFICKAKLS